ncbi:coatomer subunit alpha [Brettanomyces nanus]|uniref:Coatomer subunit alpha n=1 Tax=Eeniella nana TaxID=13502 RepID=A0A875RXJ3_EENNA|nr:coatomer subunit alpha [Brettanomyces nanus]QPG76917.1 coatomer subunit alpha [Brettanomyces nanus]
MKMLTKFESKSSRAKGVAFHPTRPWILVSLHSSTIQLWDYRMGTLIARFEGHDGPVRGIDFHPTQPIFVSGGDDYTIKVWSLKTKKCMFTLSGHLDYVRTVFFHHELPWIISASDDQTIRIWNWQSRKEIACLTGHNHYVMCAQFHPTQDLVVSASLDQTVRVWDISGLCKKHSAPQGALGMNTAAVGMNSFESQQQIPQQDIFGNTDAVVKYVLEGHDKGVNWATFHPTLPLIVSGGDDRVVKVWRMSDSRAWEVDSCRGHTNNVPCVLFHPTEDLIISVGEDKTIRTWDLNTRTPVKQFKRENDRFWLIAAHPNMNLFAACHDSGVMVFKLDRERPASTLFQNSVFFVNNEFQLQRYSFDRQEASMPLLSLKKVAVPWNKIRKISYNPAENAILIQSGENEAGIYAYIPVPKEAVGALDATPRGQGKATAACFIARNRYVTFSKITHKLEVRDLNDNVTKAIAMDSTVKDIVYAGPGVIFLMMPTKVVTYDVQQKRQIAEIQVNNAKYASWSPDGKHVALLSKHTITIANRKLESIMSMHETIRVKSAAWDDTGVLIYSTLNHLKYALLNGDIGTIKTLENTLYIMKVSGSTCFCLNRKGAVEEVQIDPTEYRFKRALVNKKFGEVLRLIQHSNLVGESIIGYLEKRGYPEVALQFVQDPETRFELAIECHNLDIALEEAQKLNKPAIWEKLGKEALSQGQISIVETVYQQLHQLEKLSFFYLITGDLNKLSKMEQIAESRGDMSSIVQNSIYLGSVEKRIQVLTQAGLAPLAYATAKSNGLDEIAQQILEDSDRDSPPELPSGAKAISVAQPKVSRATDFPLKAASLSFFEQALSGNMEHLSLEGEGEYVKSPTENGAAVAFEEDAIFSDSPVEEDDGWDMGDDQLDVDAGEKIEEESADIAGVPGELGAWIRNSKCAAGYIAAGAFEAAAQMLNKQAGITNFEPLRARFMQIYQASKLSFPAVDGLPSLPAYIRNNADESSRAAPYIPGYDQLEPLLHEGFRLFKANKLAEAVTVFRKTILIIATLVVDDEDKEEKCREILTLCREYILGLSIELKRRSLPASEVKRNLEFAAYFTRAKLQPAHRVNALQVAMTQSFKHKNYAMASFFASEFLKIMPSGARAEQAKKVKDRADSISTDAVEIDFDPYAEFEICAGTYSPIYKGTPSVSDPLTGAKYQTSEKGKLCQITQISTIGAPASGLRIRA